MRLLSALFLVAIFGIWSVNGQETAEIQLNEKLQAFAPFVGKTWKGEFQDSTAEKPTYDVSRWERALNGQAIRILHSVNDGAYGGESIIFYDREQEKVRYYYFTTAGFYTNGSMTFEDGKIISYEEVTGNENGITAVKSTGEVMADGKMKSSAQFLKNGEWVPGHVIVYQEAPNAEVVFK